MAEGPLNSLVKLSSNYSSVILVSLDHELPIGDPLLLSLLNVPPSIDIQSTTPNALDGMIVQDDGNSSLRQGFDGSIVDL